MGLFWRSVRLEPGQVKLSGWPEVITGQLHYRYQSARDRFDGVNGPPARYGRLP
jgi:hypothetical protein